MSAAALLLAGGCKGDETDGLQDAEGSMTPLVEAACAWMFGCCSDGEREFQLGEFTSDASNCTTRLVDAIKAGRPLNLLESGLSNERAEGLLLLARSINEGRVSVDDAAVRACADETATRACNVPLVLDGERCTPGDIKGADPCNPDEMFRGQQDVGEACEAAWECKPGLRCVSFFVTGVCAIAADVGEHCFSDDECAGELVCDYATGTCTVGAGVGEPCSFRDPSNPVLGTESIRCASDLVCDPASSTCTGGFCTPGAPCFDVISHVDCPEGTFCVGEPGTQRTCRPPGGIGDPCSQDHVCESGHCDPFEQVCGMRLADGQPCLVDSECASDFCEGVCSPTAGVGELCPSFRDAQCEDGYCDVSSFDPMCVGYVGAGQACLSNFECNPALDLACIEGTCRAFPLPNGLPCGSNAQCESNVCFANVCSDGTPEGGACDMGGATAPCELGTFCDVPDGETSGTCAALRRTGQACERSAQCWGDCVVRYGRQMCDQTPAYALDEVWCGGA